MTKTFINILSSGFPIHQAFYHFCGHVASEEMKAKMVECLVDWEA
jgi:hypothetical protein